MKPIEFPESMITLAKDHPQYLPIPAHVEVGTEQAPITWLWSLTWRERFKILFTGVIWHQALTFRQHLQPQMLSVEKPPMKSYPKVVMPEPESKVVPIKKPDDVQ